MPISRAALMDWNEIGAHQDTKIALVLSVRNGVGYIGGLGPVVLVGRCMML